MINQPDYECTDETFKMPFGKHKGKTLDEIEDKERYMNFLLCQEWFTGNSRDVVSNYVKQSNCDLVLNFGKYKGMTVSEIEKDINYIKFLKEKMLVAPEFLYLSTE